MNLNRFPALLLWPLLSCVASLPQAVADTFCRFEYRGNIAYGEVIDGKVHVLSTAPWENPRRTGSVYDVDEVSLLAPSQPSLIAGLVKAYRNAWPDGNEPPAIRWFFKPPGAAAAAGDPVVLPDFLDQAKVEVELVIVIGETVKNASIDDAESAIFGYSIGNDIVGDKASFKRLTRDNVERDEPLLGAGLKGADGFAPFGPFIQTDVDWRSRKRSIEVVSNDPERRVTDHTSTRDMIYPPAKIVSDLSKVMTLKPGDIIFSGTNRSFPVRAGDRARLSIEGIGSFTTVIEAGK